MAHPQYPNLTFIEEGHEYYLDGVKVPGITGVIGKYLFPDDYSGISEETLAKAAERGTEVHKLIEMADDLDLWATPEQELYKTHKDTMKWVHYGSEVLVTNGTTHATAIDKVYLNPDGTVDIADIKTTYKVDKDKLAWQLSINAMMYEQCFGVKVRNMYCVWIKKDLSDSAVIPIKIRIPDEECARLLQADAEGAETFETEWARPYHLEGITDDVATLLERSAEIEAQIKSLKAEQDGIKAQANEAFKSSGAQTWKLPYVTISRTKEMQRVSIDAKKLKDMAEQLQKDYPGIPDIYEACSKVTITPEGVTYRFK